MALISPNARASVKLTRNILVNGKGRMAGDVVDVDLETERKLLGMRVAVAHAPVVDPAPAIALEPPLPTRTADKPKGK